MTFEPGLLIGPEAIVYRTVKIPLPKSEGRMRLTIQTNDMYDIMFNDKLSPEDLIITGAANFEGILTIQLIIYYLQQVMVHSQNL